MYLVIFEGFLKVFHKTLNLRRQYLRYWANLIVEMAKYGKLLSGYTAGKENKKSLVTSKASNFEAFVTGLQRKI